MLGLEMTLVKSVTTRF